MRTCFILYMIGFLMITVSSVQYNQRCTFSFGTCNWNIGRRWKIRDLDYEIDDKVLIALGGSKEDKQMGFTDSITSSWLRLSSSCSFDIRLSFQFNIENQQDRIEVFLIRRTGTRLSSIGRWKALTNAKKNSSGDIETHWQRAEITFKAAEEFRIDIEVRHLSENKNDSMTLFGIDDILIESCPKVRTNTTSTTQQTTTTTTTTSTSLTTPLNLKIINSTLFNKTFFSFRWKFNNTLDYLRVSSSDEHLPLPPRSTFLTFILYLFYAIIASTLLIILFAIIISAYRKHCLTTSLPRIDYRYRSSRKKRSNRISIHTDNIDQDARTEKTMVTTIRTHY